MVLHWARAFKLVSLEGSAIVGSQGTTLQLRLGYLSEGLCIHRLRTKEFKNRVISHLASPVNNRKNMISL